ncbi:hypothetical protein NQ317_011576, partial [Molorchus minor]
NNNKDKGWTTQNSPSGGGCDSSSTTSFHHLLPPPKSYSNHQALVLVLHTKIEPEPEHIVRKRSISQSLRILLYYDQSVYRLDEEKI